MRFSNTKPSTLSHYEALVLDALRRVVGSLDEALDLEELASPACMAPLHFHRVFRGLVGETPLQLHRRLRLERAAWRLTQRRDTVLRIALDAGYDTHESFTRAFGEAFGRSPTEHRSLARGEAAQALHDCATRKPLNRLQAACGLHAGGPIVDLPSDISTLLLHQGALDMDVEIRTCPARRVAALTHTGPYNTIGATFDRLGSIAGPAGLFSHDGARMVAIFFDDPETVPAAKLRSAAGVIAPAGVALPSALHEFFLPEGRWASTLHRGSYQKLGDSWQRLLGQWLPSSGHRVGRGDCYELYLNHPGNASEEELRTELYVPLAD
jgi:AraC family transcriptional regulator